jgi:hypothetical protein
MGEKHADQGHRKFWPLMKSMTWKERIQHIFYYYAKYALLAAFLIFMCVSTAWDILTPDPEVILSGTTIKVNLSQEMEQKLTDGAFEAMGGTNRKKQTVTLEPTVVGPMDLSINSTIQTRFFAGDYHYVIFNDLGLEILKQAQVVPNLENILSEEQLAQWKDRLYIEERSGIPMAIDITGTALAKECTYDGEVLYITFPVIVEKRAAIEPFMTYLTEQGLLEIQ